ncbi:MAG: ATP-grasp domain-containing protein, partial [Candidatus Woesearchaeota archaeon]
LEDIQDLLEMSNPKDIQAILQEFIADSKGKDIRVLVIGGRAIGAIMRTAQGDSFKANIAGGATATAVPLNPAIEWLAVESTRILGLEIAGVDILIDGSTYKVCEVNSMPGFEGFEKATNLNIASEIFKYIHIRLGKNSNE